MGIQIHPAPLPSILARHLRLEPDEGILIVNVQVDSPADIAGLERDDIIIRLGDDPVTSREAFVDAVRRAGAGNEIALGVIHMGERKTVKMSLMSLDEMSNHTEWKYPPEPEPLESWQPGRMWFMQPGDDDWSEVPWRDFFRTPEGRRDMTKLFKELYTFRHQHNGDSYIITIEGDPSGEDAWITVRSGATEYKVTAKDIDELPEQYRQPAMHSLRKAQQQKAEKPGAVKMPALPKVPNLKRDEIFKELRQIRPPTIPNIDTEKTLEKIQEQMRNLQREVEKLRESHKDILESLQKAFKSGKSNDI